MQNQPNTNEDITMDAEPVMDSHDLKFLLRKDRLVFALIGLACITLACAWHALTPPLFKSSALIYIDPKFDQIIRYEKLGDGSASDLPSLNSLEVALMADTMVLRVLDRLGLRDDKTFLPSDLSEDPKLSDLKLVRYLQEKRFSAGLLPETRLIEITVKDPSPERAVTIANAFVEEFDHFLIEKRQEEAHSTQSKLETQAVEARSAALLAEGRLKEFREQHPETLVEQDHDLYSHRLTQSSNDLSTVVRQRMELENQLELISEVDIEANPSLVIELAGYQTMTHVSDLLSHKMNAETRLAAASIQLAGNNPHYLAAVNEKKRTEELLLELARDIKTAAASKLTAARKREESLRNQLQELQEGLVLVKTLSSEFRALKQQVEREWLVHETLQQRISESLVAGESYSNIATEFSQPLVPYKKSEPRLLITLIIGAGISAFLCAGWGVLRLLSGLPYSSREQVTRRYAIPVIGDWDRADTPPSPDEGAVFFHGLSGNNARVTLVTAPVSNGFADSIANTAAEVAAANGARVLLIVIRNDPRPDQFHAQPVLVNSDTVSRLEITPQVALREGNLENWLKESRAKYHHVFIEAGSLSDSSLVQWLSGLVDQNLVVIAKGMDSKRSIDDHIDQLASEGTPPLRLLLAQHPPKARKMKLARRIRKKSSEKLIPARA